MSLSVALLLLACDSADDGEANAGSTSEQTPNSGAGGDEADEPSADGALTGDQAGSANDDPDSEGIEDDEDNDDEASDGTGADESGGAPATGSGDDAQADDAQADDAQADDAQADDAQAGGADDAESDGAEDSGDSAAADNTSDHAATSDEGRSDGADEGSGVSNFDPATAAALCDGYVARIEYEHACQALVTNLVASRSDLETDEARRSACESAVETCIAGEEESRAEARAACVEGLQAPECQAAEPDVQACFDVIVDTYAAWEGVDCSSANLREPSPIAFLDAASCSGVFEECRSLFVPNDETPDTGR